ncbi:MAG: 16S rRNA (uracil(1498)-N(3))-methyltransferase, partial [Deltaproteobacteria bacterium]|nr:16S rRNA (uracil(1498)-N(3))-methyltransferase [Deltaproteobacteria bacterium]
MNLILLHKEDFTDTKRVRLSDRRFAHICDILAAVQGQDLQVGILGGKLGTGRISALAKDAVELTILLQHEPPPPLPATVIMALPRP